ncbi:MAG: protein-glutamate O-methyltransferase [Desulfarculaceae bacterium]|nr:protein-glutamate O-methyltransferase [Desulfarculaceae bacterium]MCF8047254.1 protein-glutamate O-methyltransferase [Desulfarculaceae bacterium]MCF8065767.1 protein-glutamate O-methyltransferase [Desulfarculaceae bacterium]MCF8097801.1 protein-glutamate O-methyltransferase [Desulfarculaceae bacterium]MCF8122342.1 protein-glutamate O-methyltransferase [Desulfarculaceae bacterium]
MPPNPPPRRQAPANSRPYPALACLSDQDFNAIAHLVESHTGIHLGQAKRNLVISRLSRRLRALGLGDFSQYVTLLCSGRADAELVEMINQITTNKTDFFREPHHFKFLSEQVLPTLENQAPRLGPKHLRAWSAGCSSGEEAYSLAMTLEQFCSPRPGLTWKLLATDLDTNMLRLASSGCYLHEQMAKMPRELLFKYFHRRRESGGYVYEVKPYLRHMISFGKFNLIHAGYPRRTPLDFIFCRNVLIYFDGPQKQAIVEKFVDSLRPGGWLFLGHSESLLHTNRKLLCVGPTIYRKP